MSKKRNLNTSPLLSVKELAEKARLYAKSAKAPSTMRAYKSKTWAFIGTDLASDRDFRAMRRRSSFQSCAQGNTPESVRSQRIDTLGAQRLRSSLAGIASGIDFPIASLRTMSLNMTERGLRDHPALFLGSRQINHSSRERSVRIYCSSIQLSLCKLSSLTPCS